MVQRLIVGTLAALFAASALPANDIEQVASAPAWIDWREAARLDVLAAYELYSANHPGMHDPANPSFRSQLGHARDGGLAEADKASGMAGYVDALGAFSAVLSDGHAQVVATQAVSPAATAHRLWPGFIAAWRGKLLVHQASADSPAPVGSEVLGCDGQPAITFIRKQIGNRGFRPKEPGHWWYRPAQAFVAVPDMWDGPKTCTFRLPDGSERQVPLTYRPAPSNFADMLAAATDGEKTPIGLTEPRRRLFMIGLPDFSPNEAGVRAYRALFAQLSRRRTDLVKARAVVIDLRHNNGGSSSWSRQAARLLWGQVAVDQRMERHFKDVRVWWRASPDNTAYVASLEDKIRKDGNNDVADSIRETAKGMKAALARNESFFVEGEEKSTQVFPAKLVPTDFRASVYVIVPGRCASACLDALDTFTRFGNVKLIGAPTSGDSTYMDVRLQDLPSGNGKVIIPNKMWAGRPRASGEVYGPHILVTELDWSTAAFLDRIESDLAKR